MSALTDLFTSFANKIRSKVGGSQTYTPLQMVDAIDDVYDAGAASVPTPASITPSNDSPVSLAANAPVNPTANGYAIESYQSRTPSASGVSFNSGLVKMSSGGYAYPTKPKVTWVGTIYNNPDLTQALTSGTLNLTQDIDNFDYIQIQAVVGTGLTSSFIYTGLYSIDEWKTMTSSNGKYAVINFTNSSYRFDRMFYYSSDTAIGYTTCHRHNASNSSAQSAYIIPSAVYGLKVLG